MVGIVNNTVSLAVTSNRQSSQQATVPAGSTGNDVPESGKDVPPPPPPVDLSQMIEQINDFMAANSRNLQFRFDDVTDQSVITVVNSNNGEIIRQIPSEEALRLAAMIKDMAAQFGGAGNLLDQLA